MTRFLGMCVLAVSAGIASSAMQPPAIAADAVYQAIRANDIGRLRSLVRTTADASRKDATGVPVLMTAAAVGSVEAMTLLLDKGADVNAQNGFGATALIWSATDLAKVQLLTSRGADVNVATRTGRTALFVAAMSEPSASIVRHLIAKGARLEARDAFQNTALTAATMGNDLETIRLMVDAGIDVNAAGVTRVTPLLGAAYHSNVAAVKLLLEKGAKTSVVAAAPILFPPESPKSGPVALTEVTPLMIAAALGTPELVQTLLDAGAPVNAKDGRGMTPLMFAIAKSRQQPAVIRMLIERGADPGIQSSAGETAADWARKVGAAPALEILNVARAENAPATAVATAPSVSAKAAAERSVALLETSSRKFFETSGCVSCHHQNITDMAVGEARARGVSTSAEHAMERLKMLSAGPPPELLYERMDIGVPEIFAASLTALAAVDVPANPAIDALVSEIAATQAADGSWHLTGGINERPPAEEGAITRTALCVRSLKAYRPAGTRRRDERARRARAAVAAWRHTDHLRGSEHAAAGPSLGRNRRLDPEAPGGADSRRPARRRRVAAARGVRERRLRHRPIAVRAVENRCAGANRRGVREGRHLSPDHPECQRVVARRQPCAEVPGLLQQRISLRRRSMDQRVGHGLGGHGARAGGPIELRHLVSW